MKYKTLFRLLLKAIGVWLFAQGACHFLSQTVTVVVGLLQQQFTGGVGAWYAALYSMGSLAQAGAGLYLFFAGEWIVNKAILSNRPYCPECAYDLTGATSNRCPECDTPFRPQDVRPASMPDDPSDAAV